MYWWTQVNDWETGGSGKTGYPTLFQGGSGAGRRVDPNRTFLAVRSGRSWEGSHNASSMILADIAGQLRRQAVRRRRRDTAPCDQCLASSLLILTDEHPRASTRRRPPIDAMSDLVADDVNVSCCGNSEGILMKAAKMRTNAFPMSRPYRGKCCGCDGYFCAQLSVAPSGEGRSPGRHRWTVGGNRGISNVGRATASVGEIKHWVPQMYYAEVAESIRQQEGDDFADGRVWVSICAGSKSDRLPAMAAGYRYLPIDICGWVHSFGGSEPNEPVDLTEHDIYDYVAGLLGGERELLKIAVVSSSIPCESHSSLNPGKHRDLETGEPRPGAAGRRARQIDFIDSNLSSFLARLLALRGRSAGPCTCDGHAG